MKATKCAAIRDAGHLWKHVEHLWKQSKASIKCNSIDGSGQLIVAMVKRVTVITVVPQSQSQPLQQGSLPLILDTPLSEMCICSYIQDAPT